MACAEDDMFDSIVMSEERFHSEGYQEGYAEGLHAGAIEGRRYGAVNGCKIGSEVGFYLGFASTWRILLCTRPGDDDKLSKKLKLLETLEGILREFPWNDATNDKLQANLDTVRGKFKQLCSVLNVQPEFTMGADDHGLSF